MSVKISITVSIANWSPTQVPAAGAERHEGGLARLRRFLEAGRIEFLRLAPVGRMTMSSHRTIISRNTFNRFGFNRGFNSRVARFDRFHHFHHFRNRFAFVGSGWDWGYPNYDYAASGDGCWRQVWTPYGWQWSNICYNYGY
jgi:hypothetical protein